MSLLKWVLTAATVTKGKKASPPLASKKPHFSYAPLGRKLNWIQSEPHDYELEPDKLKPLLLQATIGGISLGDASKMDHFIWDEIVKRKSGTRCDSLTIWTKDIEFNLLLFGDDSAPAQLRCAYFAAPESEMCKEHLTFWGKTISSTDQISNTKLKDAIQSAKNIVPSSAEGETVKQLLPQIVVWNRYTQKDPKRPGEFQRCHAFTLDPFRRELQTIPVPTDFLDAKNSLQHSSDVTTSAQSLYELVLNRYDCVTGCGTPMKRNLRALASLLSDPNIRVALVTGEPGTGKENLCKAIYYGSKLHQPPGGEPESVFLQTTAIQIQNAMRREKEPQTPSEFFQEQLGTAKGHGRRIKPNSPVIWIDELNKAEQDFLAAMLRPLEQGKEELGTNGQPKYILAASQHIDELAKQPPQDFWTRVSHQLRVVHPLSHISEEDGEAFLSSFFYAQWWSFIEVMIRDYEEEHAESLIKFLLGETNAEKGKFNPSDLCKLVRAVFINTLVPLVSRDTLSVRGARSILSQAFARVSWFVRFQRPTWNFGQPEDLDEAARLVSSAIQDVMAILNPARATPAGLERRTAPKGERK